VTGRDHVLYSGWRSFIYGESRTLCPSRQDRPGNARHAYQAGYQAGHRVMPVILPDLGAGLDRVTSTLIFGHRTVTRLRQVGHIRAP
jgi:hypothetical protein